MPEEPYPIVTVPLDEITDLRRTLSRLSELDQQKNVVLSDLGNLVGRLPDWESVDEGTDDSEWQRAVRDAIEWCDRYDQQSDTHTFDAAELAGSARAVIQRLIDEIRLAGL